jgi:diguanylate cyclase (GGDEF)-like protein/PAS domain S-box-containing protein
MLGPVGHRLTDDECRAIVEGTVELVVVFDTSATVHFVNDVALAVLGGTADDYVGHNVVEFVHPDELDRAVQALAISADFGTVPGSTIFRFRRTDGGYTPVEVSAGVIGGSEELRFALGRAAQHHLALVRTLHDLATGVDVSVALRSALDVFGWGPVDSRVGVLWADRDGRDRVVSTGLPAALTGVDAPADSIWDRVRRTGVAARSDDLSGLDPETHGSAVADGRGGYWIEPVDGPAGRALVTVWTRAASMPPGLHAQGMELACELVSVILRWTEQRRLLDLAATSDELTGLANRRAFFDVLERTGPGAVLYCDLDHFKPVNDRWGHQAGDHVLRQAAARLIASVRPVDLVARLGGDEFAVICPAAGADESARVAARIEAAFQHPFEVAGSTAPVGITVGRAHDDHLDDRVVDRADQDLMTRKESSRRQVHRPDAGGRTPPGSG